VTRAFLPLSETETAGMTPLLETPIVNWNGIRTGSIRPAGPLA
jgi:hypothetical protein